MLVVENNSVYEIDEECLKRRSVPEECEGIQEDCQRAGSGKEQRENGKTKVNDKKPPRP